MATKHSLQIKNGLKDKKIEELEAQLVVEPKSAAGEANKVVIRTLVGLVVGMFVKYMYHLFPELQVAEPDMQSVIDSLIIVASILVTVWWDKYHFQTAKNEGTVGTGVGIDGAMVKLGDVFGRKKTLVNETILPKK